MTKPYRMLLALISVAALLLLVAVRQGPASTQGEQQKQTANKEKREHKGDVREDHNGEAKQDCGTTSVVTPAAAHRTLKVTNPNSDCKINVTVKCSDGSAATNSPRKLGSADTVTFNCPAGKSVKEVTFECETATGSKKYCRYNYDQSN